MVRVGRVHQYRHCPRCKADVTTDMRFCRKCSFWLARPEIEGLRQVSDEDESPKSLLANLWLMVRLFQASLHMVILGAVLGIFFIFVIALITRNLFPSWSHATIESHRVGCYANIRVIQGALEAYLNDRKFSPALASDPVKVLFEAGVLLNRPRCAVDGNHYAIPRGSALQCVGSEGHGLP